MKKSSKKISIPVLSIKGMTKKHQTTAMNPSQMMMMMMMKKKIAAAASSSSGDDDENINPKQCGKLKKLKMKMKLKQLKLKQQKKGATVGKDLIDSDNEDFFMKKGKKLKKGKNKKANGMESLLKMTGCTGNVGRADKKANNFCMSNGCSASVFGKPLFSTKYLKLESETYQFEKKLKSALTSIKDLSKE